MKGVRKSSSERRAQIVGAALCIIANEGAQRLTAKRLGEVVGIDNSTIFRHFEDKAAIVHGAIDEFERRLVASLNEDGPAGLSAVRRFVLHRYGLVREHPELVRLAFNAGALACAGEPDQAQRVHRIVKRSLDFLEGHVAVAQRAQEIRSQATAQTLAWALSGVLSGAVICTLDTWLDPETLWHQIRGVLGAINAPEGIPE